MSSVVSVIRGKMRPRAYDSPEMGPGIGLQRLTLFVLVGFAGMVIGWNFTSPTAAMWAIGALTLVAAILLVLRFPFYAFLVFVVTLPLEATLVLEMGFTVRPSYLVLVGITLIILSQFTLNRAAGSFRSSLNVPILIYLSVSTLSIIMTVIIPPPHVDLASEVRLRGSELRSLIQMVFLFFSALGYFYTLYFCSDESRIRRALRVHIYSAIVLSVYGVYQFFGYLFDLPFVDITNALGTGGSVYHVAEYGDWSSFRSHGTFQEPLNLGHYLLSALPMVCALALYRRKRWTIPILLMSSALFLTRSRGAWIGFAGGLLTLLLAVSWKARISVLTSFIIAATSIHLIGSFLFPDVYEVLWWVTGERFEGALEYEPRLELFPFTMALFQRYPILGVGFGNYPVYQAAEFGFELLGTAYGIFWQTLAETGVLGFLAFCLLLIRFYQIVFPALKRVEGTPWYPYFLGYLASFTAMMVQYLFLGDRLNLYVWFLMGIAISTARLVEKQGRHAQ